MTAKKYFYVQCGIFVLTALLIIAGAVGGNYILQKQSTKLTNIKVENKALESQQVALLQAKKDIEKYSELESVAKSIVPQDKDQAKTVREIVKIASDNGIPIKSVSFDASSLGEKPATSKSTDATKKPTSTVASQLKPVQGINGVYTLEINVATASPVKYPNLIGFLEALEKNRRTAHVSSITLTPTSKAPDLLDFTLTLNAYVKQ